MRMRAKRFVINGTILTAFFIIAHIRMTAHFGWNRLPVTVQEAVMDLTCIIGVLTGLVLVTVGRAIIEAEKVSK